MKKFFNPYITHLEENQVFVFASNTVGRIEKSNAVSLFKAKHGVIEGRTGQCYVLPLYVFGASMEDNSKKIKQEEVFGRIKKFYKYALSNPRLEFLVCYEGVDPILSRYSKEDMARLFSKTVIPSNIVFSAGFNEFVI